ncbi:MAG: hypothetical protein ABEJ36_03585 [Candidatus Nanosalina sp.]
MSGMDPKILAAVFASIAALAIGTGGTSVGDLQDVNPQKLIGSFMDSSTGFLDALKDRPVPNNSVRVTVELNSEKSRLHLRESDLTVNNFRKLKSGSRTITSDEPLTFTGFTGDVVLEEDNKTLITGKSDGFVSSGVNFSKDFELDFRTDSDFIHAKNVNRTRIDLREVDVHMVSRKDDTVIRKGGSRLVINSFSGEVMIYPGNMTLVLQGMVDRLEAGGTVYTG